MEQIINDDCFNVVKGLPEKSVDLILTDPPFFTTDLDFDSKKISFETLFTEMKRVFKDNGWLFCFSPLELRCDILKSGWRYKFEYIWVKPAGIPATWNTKRPLTQHEIIGVYIKPELKIMSGLYFDKTGIRTKGKAYTREHKGGEVLGEFALKNRRIPYDKDGKKKEFTTVNDGYRAGTTVIYYPNKNRLKFNERTEHPTQKPLDMFKLFVGNYCPPDGTVLDPFAGSGTTAIACKELGRKYICVEKDKKYYNIIQERLNGKSTD